MKLVHVVIALSAALTALPALADDVGGSRADQCQRLFKQVSECYSTAQDADDPDHVEGAELHCDALLRAGLVACGTTAPTRGMPANRPNAMSAH